MKIEDDSVFQRGCRLVRSPGGQRIWCHIFPASMRHLERADLGEDIQEAGEATCYYEPTKKAVAVCCVSGRFLSEKYALRIDGKVYCPDAFNEQLRMGTFKHLKNSRILYDGLALGVVGIPLLPPFTVVGLYISFITAPTALFLACFSWNKIKEGVVPRSRIRAVLAIVISVVAIVAWVFIFLAIIIGIKESAKRTSQLAPRPAYETITE
jgi:hypothetical protein